MFSCQTEKKEANPKLKMPHFLGQVSRGFNIFSHFLEFIFFNNCPYVLQEAKGFDILVLWLDCDKEGENICFEVIDSVSEYMKGRRTPQNLFRAHFSSITERDIK